VEGVVAIFKFVDHSLEDRNAPTFSCEDGKVGNNPASSSCVSGIIDEGSYIKSELIRKDVFN
jgi:hypothetical protein